MASSVLIQIKLDEIGLGAVGDFAELSGVEGRAANAHFQSLGECELRWNDTPHVPVAHESRRFRSRRSLANAMPHNCNAFHPVNMVLNYVYAMLRARLPVRAIPHGFDPTVGFMHERYCDKPAHVFDWMKPLRPLVDAAILAFVAETTFAASDFTIRHDGVCRLSPELARAISKLRAAQLS